MRQSLKAKHIKIYLRPYYLLFSFCNSYNKIWTAYNLLHTNAWIRVNPLLINGEHSHMVFSCYILDFLQHKRGLHMPIIVQVDPFNAPHEPTPPFLFPTISLMQHETFRTKQSSQGYFFPYQVIHIGGV